MSPIGVTSFRNAGGFRLRRFTFPPIALFPPPGDLSRRFIGRNGLRAKSGPRPGTFSGIRSLSLVRHYLSRIERDGPSSSAAGPAEGSGPARKGRNMQRVFDPSNAIRTFVRSLPERENLLQGPLPPKRKGRKQRRTPPAPCRGAERTKSGHRP